MGERRHRATRDLRRGRHVAPPRQDDGRPGEAAQRPRQVVLLALEGRVRRLGTRDPPVRERDVERGAVGLGGEGELAGGERGHEVVLVEGGPAAALGLGAVVRPRQQQGPGAASPPAAPGLGDAAREVGATQLVGGAQGVDELVVGDAVAGQGPDPGGEHGGPRHGAVPQGGAHGAALGPQRPGREQGRVEDHGAHALRGTLAERGGEVRAVGGAVDERVRRTEGVEDGQEVIDDGVDGEVLGQEVLPVRVPP